MASASARERVATPSRNPAAARPCLTLVSKIEVDEDVLADEAPDAYLVRIVAAKLARGPAFSAAPRASVGDTPRR